jgi:hypothetical protein
MVHSIFHGRLFKLDMLAATGRSNFTATRSFVSCLRFDNVDSSVRHISYGPIRLLDHGSLTASRAASN